MAKRKLNISSEILCRWLDDTVNELKIEVVKTIYIYTEKTTVLHKNKILR